MPIRFPSLAFFEALRDEMRAARERFSRLGFFDTTFAVRVLDDGGAPLFEGTLGFEVFDCSAVREGLDGGRADFVLEGASAGLARDARHDPRASAPPTPRTASTR